MSGKGAKKAPRKKGANGYKLPDPIPQGEILTDMKKEQWIIGKSIGVGGFGEIYSAAPYKGKTPSEYPAVIKIEPHGNGPLFVEMHFYMRNANATEIDAWKRKNKLSELGMPRFLGSGSHECNQTKYRFVVMDRYGTDLWKLFLENGPFSEKTVYKVAWQIINVLEYMHHKTYVHADIKGGNLLLGLKSPNQVFLVDFGLASHINTKTEYKVDPRKAHNGTIEYTSRDAHMGLPTVRGDFEILAYNMIQWLCGSLPWEKNLSNKTEVHKEKEKAFENPKKFLETCFSRTEVPETINQFMNLLSTMKFTDVADYQKFRDILVKGLKKLGDSPEGKLDFDYTEPTPKKLATPKKTKIPVANGKRTRTPVVEKTIKTPVGRSPRIRKVDPPVDLLNSSIDSIVMDEKCMTGEDMRKKLLMKIDADAEYVVQIKKRKTKTASKDDTPSKSDNPPKRGRRNVTSKRILDDSLESEPEVKPTKGTRSRPGPKSSKSSETKPKTITLDDSDADMFDDV